MKKTFCLIVAATCLSVSVFAADTTKGCPGFDAGTKAYNEGDFERAADEWQTCVDNSEDVGNADLYYNLGNAYFRSGKLGYAIYNYKSALRLRPNDADIQHNLNFAQAMTKDKVEESDEENPLLAGLFKAHHAVSLKGQLFILLGLFWIIALLAIGNKVSLSEKKKNVFMGGIFGLTMIFAIFAASAGYKIFVTETESTGVVTAADADVTSAPNEKSQTLNTLSEGTSFEILSEQGPFLEIKLGERIKGFVRKRDVGVIR